MPEITHLNAAWDEFIRNHGPGDFVHGTVAEVTGKGAVVDLGGVRGRIHIQDVAWGHGPLLPAVGTTGWFVVFGIDPQTGVVALSSPVLHGEKWAKIEEHYPVESRHSGQVVQRVSYGVFVQLEPGW
jgi:small subunit ribosomal protein S1